MECEINENENEDSDNLLLRHVVVIVNYVMFYCVSSGSSITVLPTLWVEQPRNWGLIPSGVAA